MDLIEEFLKQYNKQYDFYSELGRIGYIKLETELAKRGIKAIVSFRAKNPERLREKLVKRNEEKQYKTLEEIGADIVDLAGVRVSLYFPSDRSFVNEVVVELFEIVQEKSFPGNTHNPGYTKRFSGYWATHYRVEIKKNDEKNKRYQSVLFEIQVASVLMHAWSEVEHDLVYKPFSGDLSEEELAILDEINGLVITGEIALERLQKAMTRRIENSKKEITDKYEITNYLINSIKKADLVKLKLGDTKLLNNYFDNVLKFNKKDFSKYLESINENANESVADQLLDMLLLDYFKGGPNKSLEKFFLTIYGRDRNISAFEGFVKAWILLEKALFAFNQEKGIKNKKYLIPDFTLLISSESLSNDDLNKLNRFRNIRNEILHGVNTPSNDYLLDSFTELKKITKKIIDEIKNTEKREMLLKELNSF